MENADDVVIAREEVDAAAAELAAEAALPPGVKRIAVEDEMERAYLDYAMSVIVSRALPDVRDGMKPVHRRIVYAMDEGGNHASKKHRKSARAVGDVMGLYHPHGDSAIYETMVRLAQPFSLRHPLIDGQGNFGSRDGDPAAAMRYTESKMSRLAHELTADVAKLPAEYWTKNYDQTRDEPKVLPAKFPNLLVNGGTGIAVAMATNIPTHNLGETLDACLMLMDKPDATLDDIMTVLPGPDFPVKCKIMGRGGIRQAYETGRGSIRMAGEAEIEEMKGGKHRIVITKLPFGVSAVSLLQKIHELAQPKDKKNPSDKGLLDGVVSAQDESDKEDDIRVVLELRKDADPSIILNALVKYTPYVTPFSYNGTVLDSTGKPEVMPLLKMLKEFINFRREIVRKRTIHDLDKARDALHKQIGLYAATSMVDEVVKAIRTSADADQARMRLLAMEFPTAGDFAQLVAEADPDLEIGDVFKLSDIQVKTILEMRLQKLTGLERDEIAAAAREISAEINRYLPIVNDPKVLDDVIRNEWTELRAKHSSPRTTSIEADMDDVDDEDLIERKDIVLTITKSGYVKCTDLDAFREQKRGGKGRTGMETKDDDFVTTTLICSTRTPLVFFTSRGIAHSLKAYKLPQGVPSSKGRPLINFVPLRQDETISAVIAMPETEAELDGKSLVFVTDFGTVRRNEASAFWGINKAGKIAIKLEDEHGNPEGKLVEVLLASDDDDILVATERGICVRFPLEDLRVMKSRDSSGVKAIALDFGNRVIGASKLRHFRNTSQERDAYLEGGSFTIKNEDGSEEVFTLSPERMEEMRSAEETLLTVSALGYGKRSSSYGYRITARGAKGISAANINSSTGALVSCFTVSEDDGLVLVTDGGQTIRTRVKDVRYTKRVARGVKMFDLPKDQKIVSVARVSVDDLADFEVTVPALSASDDDE